MTDKPRTARARTELATTQGKQPDQVVPDLAAVDFTDALRPLLAAAKLEPQLWITHYHLGRIYRNNGLWNEAAGELTAADTFAKLKAHLAKRGCGDLDIKMTGGCDPNSTWPDSRLIQAQVKVYQKAEIKPILWRRLAGSWPVKYSPATRCGSRPATSACATAAARTLPTSTT